ncbi:hypothetical protein E2C01_021106 [Portunus trituberculatus]|uniref:Uncharacterized protein n=1 Tax=Portunus trituberculatus TaxID=210409 RepID=A0A5B7E3J7_PORTR|nr:hypothetical protein [Portunus trituberculatus]
MSYPIHVHRHWPVVFSAIPNAVHSTIPGSLTASVAVSSLVLLRYQIMVGGGRDPLTSHTTRYSLPAISGCSGPVTSTDNAGTGRETVVGRGGVKMGSCMSGRRLWLGSAVWDRRRVGFCVSGGPSVRVLYGSPSATDGEPGLRVGVAWGSVRVGGRGVLSFVGTVVLVASVAPIGPSSSGGCA